ncbi:MAG: hypothetical protein ACE5KV_08690 [Thermoplasmata archaeon]
MRELYSDFEALTSVGNRADASYTMDKEKKGRYRIELKANEPAYVILGVSYDEGWTLVSNASTKPLELLDYEGLSMFHVEEPGSYRIAIEFTAHSESLAMIGAFSGGAFFLALLFVSYPRLVPRMKSLCKRIRALFPRGDEGSRGPSS